MYARAITSRKNICLTLAKKYQLKFAHFILNDESNQIVVVAMENIISSKHNEFVFNTLNISSNFFNSYSKMNFKGTDYKIGNYVTNFINEFCLYEILEIIVLQNNIVLFTVHQIQLVSYNLHFKAYEVGRKKSIIAKSLINIEHFSGPPINIHQIPNGKLMIRLKEYY